MAPEIKEGKSLDQFKLAQNNYFSDQENPEMLIWYGRRVAYLGYFKEAIKIYTLGIEKFPYDARFYRHRGHRYISTRQYDNAINDFKRALELVDGKEDQIEANDLPSFISGLIKVSPNKVTVSIVLSGFTSLIGS